MKTFLQAELIAHIEVEDKDFEFLKDCCDGHYDFKVSSTVKQGGFLYGHNNRRHWAKDRGEEDKVMTLKFWQIDLLLKALERGYIIELGRATRIGKSFQHILAGMNEKYKTLNPQLQNEFL